MRKEIARNILRPRRMLALLLACLLVFAMLPVSALAAADTPEVKVNVIYANGAEITIEAGTTDGYSNIVYGSNTRLKIGGTEPSDEGYDLSGYSIYGGGFQNETAGTKITMTGGTVKNIYGGGYKSKTNGNTEVAVGENATVTGCIFGAGSGVLNYKSEVTGNTTIVVAGTVQGTVYGGGEVYATVGGSTSITVSPTAKVTSSVFGGGNNTGTDIEGDTSVTVNGGTMAYVYGGGRGSAVKGTAKMTIHGGTVTESVIGGGNSANAPVHNTEVTINNGTIKSVIGGGYGAVTENTQITINGGMVTGNVHGGGRWSSGTVSGNTKITISDGTINGNIYGGGDGSSSANVTGSAEIIISGGTVQSMVFGSGANGSTVGSASVTVGGTAKIGTASSDGVAVNGNGVTNGVDSFAIAPDLSDGAAVYVALPTGYTAGTTFATGAVETDKNYVHIAGTNPVTDGKIAYDSGTLFVKAVNTYNLDEIDTDIVTAMESDANYTLSKPIGLQNLATLVNREASAEASGYTVTMLGDIDCAGQTITPIGVYQKDFSGTFDGGNNTVFGLNIDSSGQDDTGLFGYVDSSVVKNLTVEGTVTGGWNVGGIIGYAYNGSVENCASKVTVTGGGNVGGVVGCAEGVTINGCTFDGAVKKAEASPGPAAYNSSSQSFGGIAGVSAACVVENCKSSGTVTGEVCVGGIVGNSTAYMANSLSGDVDDSPSAGDVKNCSSSATVTGVYDVGGVVGANVGGTVSGCEFTGAVEYKEAANSSDPKGFGGIVGYSDGGGAVVDCASAGAVTGEGAVGGIVGYNSYDEYYYALSTSNEEPSPGMVKGCSSYATVTGASEVGGIVGVNAGGVIRGCSFTGESVTGEVYVGGVVGLNEYMSMIENCCATGAVSGAYGVGGVVGENKYTSTVQNCYATGAVTGSDSYADHIAEGFGGVGGVAGTNYESTIENCYATGAVAGIDAHTEYSNGGVPYVGGVVGYINGGTIQNCYATGTVSGADYVGGIAGQSMYITRSTDYAQIQNCAALGLSVTATGVEAANVGRVCGNGYALANNVARGDMLVNDAVVEDSDENIGGEKAHGATITVGEATCDNVFFEWQPSIWDIPTGNVTWGGALPTLQAITAAQNPTLPGDAPHYVAEITASGVTTKYTTLQRAVVAAVSGDTIKVLDNIALDAMLEIAKTITLDLKGFAITGSTIKVTEKGVLTVTDTSTGKTGKIDTSAGTNAAIHCEGTLTVSGGTITSAAASGVGTIYLTKTNNVTPTLTIGAGAAVTNTENNNYAVYFADDSGVTVDDLDTYFTCADGANVGRIYPHAMPSVENISGRSCIFANGTDLKFEAGTDGKTKVSYREMDSAYSYLPYEVAWATGDTTDGYDLSRYDIYGGSNDKQVDGDAKIAMDGGKVYCIYGGGYGSGGTVTGSTTVTVGGTVTGYVYGGGYKGAVGRNTEVNVLSSGTVNGNVFGGGREGAVDGTTSVTVSGKAGIIYGGGNNDEVKGKTAVTVKSGGEADNIYGGGNGENARVGSTEVKVESSATVNYGVNGGGYDGAVTGDTSVTIGGTVNGASGGGRNSAVGGNTSVTILSGAMVNYSVYGGSSDAEVRGKATVTIGGKVCENVYGGGSGEKSKVGSAEVKIESTGEVVGNDYGYNGSVYGGGNSGDTVIGDTSVIVDGAVNAVYGGGNGATVSGNVAVTIGNTGTVKYSVYGGDGGYSGGTVTGDTSLTVGGAAKVGGNNSKGVILNGTGVTNGVDSFVIDAAQPLASGAAVYVVLPQGFTAGTTIATGAAEGDVDYIHLTGTGVGYLVPTFDGSDTVKVIKADYPLPITLTDSTTAQELQALLGDNATVTGDAGALTITLTGNKSLSTNIKVTGGEHTLVLNEHTLTIPILGSAAGCIVVTGGSLDISGGTGGTVKAATGTAPANFALLAVSGGEAALASGKLTNAGMGANGWTVRATGSGKFTMTGGEIVGGSYGNALYAAGADNAALSGGTIDGGADNKTAVQVGEGGTVGGLLAEGCYYYEVAEGEETKVTDVSGDVLQGKYIVDNRTVAQYTKDGGDTWTDCDKLFEAIAAMQNAGNAKNCQIRLTDDVQESISTTNGGFTINLNGHTWTCGAEQIPLTLENGADIVITDSIGGGTIKGVDAVEDCAALPAISLKSGAALTLTGANAFTMQGGKGLDSATDEELLAGAPGVSVDGGTLEVSGGMFQGGDGGSADSGGPGGAGVSASDSDLSVTGGSFTGGAGGNSSGTISYTDVGFGGGPGGPLPQIGGFGGDGISMTGGTLTVSNGAFTGGAGGKNTVSGAGNSSDGGAGDGLYLNTVIATVDGGVFDGQIAIFATGGSNAVGAGGTTHPLVVNEGVFTGEIYGLSVSVVPVTVNGGTFTGGNGAVVIADRAGALAGGTFTGGGTNAYAILSGTPSNAPKASALLADGKAYFGADGAQLTEGLNEASLGKNTTIRVLNAPSAPDTYSISGVVEDHDGDPIIGAKVSLKQGAETVAVTWTDAQGGYVFGGVPTGLYNVVAEHAGLTMTILVALTEDANEKDIKLPEAGKNSVVDVKKGAPALVAGGVEQVAESQNTNVMLQVTVPEDPMGGDEIEAEAEGKTLEYLDIRLLKVSTGVHVEIHDSNVVLELVLPYDFTNKKDVTVYRYHKGETEAETLTGLEEKPAEGAAIDGTFWADEDSGYLHIYASKFSTYAVGYTPVSGVAVYTVSASAGAGGAISPSGNVRIVAGSNKTFAIVPQEGYVVADVLVDGKSVGAVTEYTFERVARNHTIVARFKAEAAAWNPFVDVDEGDWFHDSVRYVYERGIMLGTSGATFEPYGSTERGMIVTILWRLEGEPEAAGSSGFSDLASGAYYTQAVAWAAEKGIVEGFGDGTFRPGVAITREQLATALWRYAQYKDMDMGVGAALDPFIDAAEISGYAQEAMRWAVGWGIISGKGGGVLDPQGQATRAETAALLEGFAAIAEK